MCVTREMMEDADEYPRIGSGGGGIDQHTARHQAWSAGGVMILFAVTWLVGVLVLRKPTKTLEWLFCVFNTLTVVLMLFSRCIFYPRVLSTFSRMCARGGNSDGSIAFSRGRRWPTTGRESVGSSSLSQVYNRHEADRFANNSVITSAGSTNSNGWLKNVTGDDSPTPTPLHRRPKASPSSDNLKYGRSNVNFNNSESISAFIEKKLKKEQRELENQLIDEIDQLYDEISAPVSDLDEQMG